MDQSAQGNKKNVFKGILGKVGIDVTATSPATPQAEEPAVTPPVTVEEPPVVEIPPPHEFITHPIHEVQVVQIPLNPLLTLVFKSNPGKYITQDMHFNRELAERDAKDPAMLSKIIKMNPQLTEELRSAGIDIND